jgi:hypothetical protein
MVYRPTEIKIPSSDWSKNGRQVSMTVTSPGRESYILSVTQLEGIDLRGRIS